MPRIPYRISVPGPVFREDRERAEKKDPCDKVQGLGLVPVFRVDIQEDEEGGGNGKDEELQHHRTVGSRNTKRVSGRYIPSQELDPAIPREAYRLCQESTNQKYR
jgi:hypothetical protein